MTAESIPPILRRFSSRRERLDHIFLRYRLRDAVSYDRIAEIYAGEPGRKMIFTALTEAFFTYVKVSFWAAICLSFPIIAMQIWKFVAPGLYKNERRAFLPYLCATPVLFVMGASLAYFVVIPTAFRFFLSFETPGTDGSRVGR